MVLENTVLTQLHNFSNVLRCDFRSILKMLFVIIELFANFAPFLISGLGC